jgi:hypothetical protein
MALNNAAVRVLSIASLAALILGGCTQSLAIKEKLVEVVDIANGPKIPSMALRQGSAISQGGTFNFPATIRTYNADITFTISNSGNGTLTFSGSPIVVLGGTDAARFSVLSQPSGTVAPGSSTTFTLRFIPAAVSTYSATVTLASDDPTYPSFTFNVGGSGTEWHGIATVDTGNVGMYSSLGVNGVNIVIGYQDMGNKYLKVIKSNDRALTWQTASTPDTSNGAGYYVSLSLVGSAVSIASTNAPVMAFNPRYVSGTVGSTSISWGSNIDIDTVNLGKSSGVARDSTYIYYVYSSGSGTIHVRRSSNGTTWTDLDFDSFGGTMATTSGAMVAASAAGNGLYIAYPSATNKLVSQNHDNINTPNPWISGTADNSANNVGQYPSITSDGKMAYYDATSGDLKFVYAYKQGADPTMYRFSSPVAIDTSGNVGQYTSIASSSDGLTVYISYYDVTNAHLKFIRGTGAATGTTPPYAWTWSTPATVDASASVGTYSSIEADGNNIYISYFDAANNSLKLAKSLDGGVTW